MHCGSIPLSWYCVLFALLVLCWHIPHTYQECGESFGSMTRRQPSKTRRCQTNPTREILYAKHLPTREIMHLSVLINKETRRDMCLTETCERGGASTEDFSSRKNPCSGECISRKS